MKARQQSNGDYKPVPVGAHVAIVDAVIDLGLQGGGKFEPAFKVAIRWQLPGNLNDAGKPMTITQTYTSSMNKKANLRKLVEAMFGKAFPSDQAANEFDLKNLIGRACLVSVIHKESGDKTFANVGTAMPLPAGTAKPALDGSPLYYADELPSDERAEAFARLPEWLQEKIANQLHVEERGEAERSESASVGGDDIPF
jgi:hypothetical protein